MRASRERLGDLGIDLDQLALLVGAGESATVLTDRSIAYPYPWAAFSFLGVAFWCWRLRHVLR